jgi:UDP-glucose 4-epimerase
VVIRPDLADAFLARSVLITGGLGFLGSNLAHELVAHGARVTLVDALVADHGGLRFNVDGIEDAVRIDICDVREDHRLPELVAGQDFVFNLAGQNSHIDSMRDPYTDLEINCRSQLSIMEACRQHNPTVKVVFASTRQIYGRPRRLPVDEEHPIAPVDVNGINKTAGEWYHLLYGGVYGIPVTVLRLTNTYGPRMRVRDARQTFLGVWFKLVLTGRQFQVWGDGSQQRDFTYVDDAVSACLLAASRSEANGEVYNLGGESHISLRELAELLVEMNGSGSFELVPYPPERKPIDVGDFYADYSKIERELGWRPTVGLREGLARTLAYYRRHGVRYWDE